MKKHLRILYGCDDRFDIVINTVNVCEKYFDSITILNSGPAEFYEKLTNAVTGKVVVRQLNKFLEIESCRRAMVDDVPENEWVLWLDADERPSPELLNDFDNVLNLAEKENFNVVRFIWCEHTEGVMCPIHPNIPKTHEEFAQNHGGHYFMPSRLIKKQKNMCVSSNFGSHETFILKNEKQMYNSNIVFHMTSHLQYHQSIVFSGFLNPFSHVNCANLQTLRECIDRKKYIMLREFQKKTNVYTSNDFVKKIKIEKDEIFIEDVKKLFSSFRDADQSGPSNSDITFNYMLDFCEKYNLDVESPHYPCNKSCCVYNGIQL